MGIRGSPHVLSLIQYTRMSGCRVPSLVWSSLIGASLLGFLFSEAPWRHAKALWDSCDSHTVFGPLLAKCISPYASSPY